MFKKNTHEKRNKTVISGVVGALSDATSCTPETITCAIGAGKSRFAVLLAWERYRIPQDAANEQLLICTLQARLTEAAAAREGVCVFKRFTQIPGPHISTGFVVSPRGLCYIRCSMQAAG